MVTAIRPTAAGLFLATVGRFAVAVAADSVLGVEHADRIRKTEARRPAARVLGGQSDGTATLAGRADSGRPGGLDALPFAGVVLVEGAAVPLVDLERLVGTESKPSATPRLTSNARHRSPSIPTA